MCGKNRLRLPVIALSSSRTPMPHAQPLTIRLPIMAKHSFRPLLAPLLLCFFLDYNQAGEGVDHSRTGALFSPSCPWVSRPGPPAFSDR